jgi:hypothetical protein
MAPELGLFLDECYFLTVPCADLNTPMAPELGLFLDECYFEAYNRQWGEQHPCLRQADFTAQVDAFKVGFQHVVGKWKWFFLLLGSKTSHVFTCVRSGGIAVVDVRG